VVEPKKEYSEIWSDFVITYLPKQYNDNTFTFDIAQNGYAVGDYSYTISYKVMSDTGETPATMYLPAGVSACYGIETGFGITPSFRDFSVNKTTLDTGVLNTYLSWAAKLESVPIDTSGVEKATMTNVLQPLGNGLDTVSHTDIISLYNMPYTSIFPDVSAGAVTLNKRFTEAVVAGVDRYYFAYTPVVGYTSSRYGVVKGTPTPATLPNRVEEFNMLGISTVEVVRMFVYDSSDRLLGTSIPPNTLPARLEIYGIETCAYDWDKRVATSVGFRSKRVTVTDAGLLSSLRSYTTAWDNLCFVRYVGISNPDVIAGLRSRNANWAAGKYDYFATTESTYPEKLSHELVKQLGFSLDPEVLSK
jgi:hypothetical protein